MPPGSNGLVVNPLKHLSRTGAIRVHDRDPIFAKAGRHGCTLACSQISEIQIAHHSRRVNDRDRYSSLFSRGVDPGQTLAAGAEEFHSTNRSQADDEAVHAITDVGRRTAGPPHLPSE